jgi:hypothetical protein
VFSGKPRDINEARHAADLRHAFEFRLQPLEEGNGLRRFGLAVLSGVDHGHAVERGRQGDAGHGAIGHRMTDDATIAPVAPHGAGCGRSKTFDDCS